MQLHTWYQSSTLSTKPHLCPSTSADGKAGKKGGTISLYKAKGSSDQSIKFKWFPEVKLCLFITKQDAIVQQNFQKRSNN